MQGLEVPMTDYSLHVMYLHPNNVMETRYAWGGRR